MSNLLIEGDVAKPLTTTLAQLAQALGEADFHSGQSDTATQSREILETEYADTLKRRTDERPRPTLKASG